MKQKKVKKIIFILDRNRTKAQQIVVANIT